MSDESLLAQNAELRAEVGRLKADCMKAASRIADASAVLAMVAERRARLDAIEARLLALESRP
jgi:hypothetical protein